MLLSAMLWPTAPVTFAMLDWAAYDAWLRHRAPIPVSSSVMIVKRDRAAEDLLGGGSWDRALLARLLTTVHEAGAAVIGLDHRLDHASPAQLGGAASDALLLEAIKSAAPVVVPLTQSDSPFAGESMTSGHLAVSIDPDHVVRRVPADAGTDAPPIPAFGSVLFELFQAQGASAVASSSARPDSFLVNYVGDGTLDRWPTLPLSAVWSAIEQHDNERLTEWFQGKAVVLLPDPLPAGTSLLPTGQVVSEPIVHVQLLNMLLTQNRLSRVESSGRIAVVFLLAWSAAWLVLRAPGVIGLLLGAASIGLYGTLVVLALPAAHLVLPLAWPVTAAVLVLVSTATGRHLITQQRLTLLEQDMLHVQQEAAAVRDALVLRETRAETLQEELAVARAAVAHSAGQQEQLAKTTERLRAQLADAQTQEEAARATLAGLERQLHSLRAATVEPAALDDAELGRLRDECRQLGIVTQDARLLCLYRDVKKGARSPLTVLLLGEPGTGKELFARAVHRLSPRTSHTFIAVNMAAVSPELFESELFGHVKGSFTGATADRRGYFELAHRGTIFLDEIGDLRLDHQSKLLRVLQEKSFYRVGATTPTTVDVRIVAATNRDLQRGVSEGWFREDLYFRLTGLVFRLPPLRDRAGDIPLLADIFLADIAAQMGKSVPKLSTEAMQMLTDQEWKGNVRELRHCLEQAVALSEASVLTNDSLRLGGEPARPATRARPAAVLPDSAGDAAVLECLRRHEFDMQATAMTLAWDRSTVTQRLKGLCFQALVDSNGDQAAAALAIAGDPSHARTVELKLMDYYSHLLSVIEPFTSADDATAECKRRFKNLPERHFKSLEMLVRQRFPDGQSGLPGSASR